MHCRADAPRSNPTRAFLNFFSLKIEETWTFMNRNFKRLEKFHVRKVKCLVRATERKMSVWRMETSGDLINNNDNQKHHSLGWRNLSSWLLTVSCSLYSSFLIHARLCSLLFAVYSVLIGSCSVLMTLVILVYTYLIVVCVSFDLLFFSCIKHFALP